LPELVLIEGIQQVAMKRDESLSPSLFTFRSYFATIHHFYHYDCMTAQGARVPGEPVLGPSTLSAYVPRADSK
jgi:hypothetical protein